MTTTFNLFSGGIGAGDVRGLSHRNPSTWSCFFGFSHKNDGFIASVHEGGGDVGSLSQMHAIAYMYAFISIFFFLGISNFGNKGTLLRQFLEING